jgi:hypothetical protein
MIRLSWRQFRTQAAVACAVLAVIAVILAITGPHLVHLYDTTVAPCKTYGDCGLAQSVFVRSDGKLQSFLADFLLVVPALIGIFWGAPLIARELEAGTFRLAWTQSITRKRWLAAKLGVVGLASIAVAALLSLMVTWWSNPFDRVNADRFSPAMFGERGITPVGYAAFAFVLGVTAGVLIRRTLPAMAGTLAAFVGARVAMTIWVRPHLIAPVRTSLSFLSLGSKTGVGIGNTPSGLSMIVPETAIAPNAWIYTNQIIDTAGHAPTNRFLRAACPLAAGGPPPGSQTGGGSAGPHSSPSGAAAFHACIAKVAAQFRVVVTYQPAGRYWAFQACETAIFLALALILAGVCLWWIRHRLS